MSFSFVLAIHSTGNWSVLFTQTVLQNCAHITVYLHQHHQLAVVNPSVRFKLFLGILIKKNVRKKLTGIKLKKLNEKIKNNNKKTNKLFCV